MFLQIIGVWGVEVPNDEPDPEGWAREYVRGTNPDTVQIERVDP